MPRKEVASNVSRIGRYHMSSGDMPQVTKAVITCQVSDIKFPYNVLSMIPKKAWHDNTFARTGIDK